MAAPKDGSKRRTLRQIRRSEPEGHPRERRRPGYMDLPTSVSVTCGDTGVGTTRDDDGRDGSGKPRARFAAEVAGR